MSKQDKFLFSKELRDTLKPFGKMDVTDALRSEHFLRALCNHAGIEEGKFDEIMNSSEETPMTEEEAEKSMEKTMKECEDLLMKHFGKAT